MFLQRHKRVKGTQAYEYGSLVESVRPGARAAPEGRDDVGEAAGSG